MQTADRSIERVAFELPRGEAPSRLGGVAVVLQNLFRPTVDDPAGGDFRCQGGRPHPAAGPDRGAHTFDEVLRRRRVANPQPRCDRF